MLEISLLCFRNVPSLNVAQPVLNEFKGTIPSEIGLLTQLKMLGLSGNRFTGMLPSELGLLTQLETLVFRDNSITGTIPNELFQLTQLEALHLGSFHALIYLADYVVDHALANQPSLLLYL